VAQRNIERNLGDGWTFASTEHYENVHDKIVGEEKPLDTKVRRRGMVLMEIPEEMAKQREAFYADKIARLSQGIAKQHQNDAADVGVATYTPK